MKTLQQQLSEVRDKLFVRRCARKQRYPNRDIAMRTKKGREIHGDTKHLHVYECPHCGGWHLTRMEQPK